MASARAKPGGVCCHSTGLWFLSVSNGSLERGVRRLPCRISSVAERSFIGSNALGGEMTADNLRVCLSLFACEPHRGSEPGVGWAWALGMAKRHEPWVLTRANNRDSIEAELDRLAVSDTERPHFVWVDLPRGVRWLKKRRIVPVGLYYLLWQFAARRAWNRTGVQVDIVHHITFNSFVIPGVWWHRREKVVLGPLGGMSICPPQYLRCFPFFPRVREFLRGKVRAYGRFGFFFRKARGSADYVIYTTDEMLGRLGGGTKSAVMLETAVPTELEHRLSSTDAHKRERRFVWAGTLAGHKAGEIAIRSFAKAFGASEQPHTLEIYGSGPDRGKWENLVRLLGATEYIRFRGTVPQTELWERVSSSKALLFTSIRDTSGNVALEALALGTPVICFRHQGIAQIVDASCSLTVEPSDWSKTINDFALALRRLADDADLSDQLGAMGRKRVLERFTWARQFDEMDGIYHSLKQASN